MYEVTTCDDIEERRVEGRHRAHRTIGGSSNFYGCCNLFFECEMQVNELKRTCLRSKTIDPNNLGIDDSDNVDEDEHDEVAAEPLVKGSIVAFAAYDKNRDSFYLLKIVK